jgi:hypothetical protein
VVSYTVCIGAVVINHERPRHREAKLIRDVSDQLHQHTMAHSYSLDWMCDNDLAQQLVCREREEICPVV